MYWRCKISTTSVIPKVVTFSYNAVYAGDLPADPAVEGTLDLIASGETALAGPDIESAYMVDPKDGKTKLFAVDGTDSIIVDVIGTQLVQWADRVLLVGKGVLPPACALIAVWAGNMVLARQPSQPSIWYKSRTLNPYDWEYGALPLPTTAVAGTDPTVSQPGDAIKSLMPFSQDYLVFGCLSSLYTMIGDPAAGGAVRLISKRTGVLGPRAWCIDTRGIMYVLGNSGLFRIVNPLQEPENLGGTKLIGILDRLDTSDATGCRPELAYDAFKGTVNIYLTPRNDSEQGLHVIVDSKTGDIVNIRPFLDQYPIRVGPHSTLEIDGEADQNRRILLGGNNGYVYRYLDGETADDGDPIESFFDSAPMELPGAINEMTATELQAAAYSGPVSSAGDAFNSDPVTFELYTANSPNEVRLLSFDPIEPTEDIPTVTGALFDTPGFQTPIGLRQTAAAFKLRIKQTSDVLRWAMDRIVMIFEIGPRRR